jgi:hypothetical protein
MVDLPLAIIKNKTEYVFYNGRKMAKEAVLKKAIVFSWLLCYC